MAAKKGTQLSEIPDFPAQVVSQLADTVTLSWSALSGTTYRVQFKTNATDTTWGDLVPDVTATGATASAADNAATNALRLYRLLVMP